MYKCPNCNQILNKEDNVYKCINRHSFDISKYGHVNLLLSNQKHSQDPGDNKEMIMSRVSFLSCDYYDFLRKKILEIIKKYAKNETLSFADLACGEGYYTNFLHAKLQNDYKINTIGIDISKYAIIEACKKKKQMKLDNIDYCIGNLMNMPFFDDSFDFMLNCFALLDVKEFNRVLKKGGYFIRVLPDTYHLYELKEILYDKVILNREKDNDLEGFKLVDTIHIEDKITLKNKQEIHDLFTMTPYYYKTSKEDAKRLLAKDSLTTRVAFSLYVYMKI